MSGSSSQRDFGRVSVLVAPASDPIAIDGPGGVKMHLRVDHVTEDDLITNALQGAVNEIDAPHGWLGRSLITRTLRLTLDARPPPIVYLPGPPVTEVKRITVRDSDDNLDVIYDSVALLTANTIVDGISTVVVTVTEKDGTTVAKTFVCEDTTPNIDAGEFASGANDTEACVNLAAAINHLLGTLILATASAATVILTALEPGEIAITLSGEDSTIVASTLAVVDEIGLMYDLTAEPALVWPDDDIGWPSDIKSGIDSVRIDYRAGYADEDKIPRVIRQWLLMRTAELYRDREPSIVGTITSNLKHADRMLDSWRVRA